jgi:putative transposase
LTPGSKAVNRLGRLHQRIARQRADWLHKCSTAIADQHAVIAIEDLRVASMTASARGTRAAPGKQVRQKAGLNRAILDASWREFARQLAYKLEDRGGALVRVPAAYTSQRCHCCGHTAAQNRRSRERFECVACGHAEHADVNAAKNILAAGHAAWAQHTAAPAACGEDVRRAAAAPPPRRAASRKQEPTEALSAGSSPADRAAGIPCL